MKKLLLIGTAFVLLMVGFLVIYLKYYGSDLVNQSKTRPSAETNQNQSSAISINNSQPAESIISQDQFVKSDLKYTTSFIGFSVPNTLEESATKTIVENISYSGSTLKITLQQEQSCTEDQKLPSQSGFYFSSENVVTLYNLVNNSAVENAQKCAVRLEYDIENLTVDTTKNLSVKWQAETSEQTTFPICFYNGKPYNNDDVFAAMAKCSTCTCVNGVVTCEDNKKCIENEQKAQEEAKVKADADAKAQEEAKAMAEATPTPTPTPSETVILGTEENK
jgi:hypothetical protein